jgi:hypothetical protein
MCPCNFARLGVCLLTWCVYAAAWPQAFFGHNLAWVLARAKAGDISDGMVIWATFAAAGLLCLVVGLREALTHDDDFDGASFAWSVGVIALATFALLNHWYLNISPLTLHASRALWLGWMAGNVVNIGLQLRSLCGHYADSAPRASHSSLSVGRWEQQTTEWYQDESVSYARQTTEWYEQRAPADSYLLPPPDDYDEAPPPPRALPARRPVPELTYDPPAPMRRIGARSRLPAAWSRS